MSSTRVHHRGVLHYIHPSSVCMILFPCLRGTPSSAFYLVYMVPSSLDSFYIWFAVKFPAVFSSFFGPFYNYFLRAPSSHSLSSFRSWFLILDLLSLSFGHILMLALEPTCIAQPISTDAPSLLLFVFTRTSDCIPLVPFVHRGHFPSPGSTCPENLHHTSTIHHCINILFLFIEGCLKIQVGTDRKT